MNEQEIALDEIVVAEDERQPGRFHVIVVQLNKKHRAASDTPKEFIGSSLPLDLANELAKSEGEKRGLRVTTRVAPDTGGTP
jgi:hypothetical protein